MDDMELQYVPCLLDSSKEDREARRKSGLAMLADGKLPPAVQYKLAKIYADSPNLAHATYFAEQCYQWKSVPMRLQMQSALRSLYAFDQRSKAPLTQMD